jgi:hypothetical protein
MSPVVQLHLTTCENLGVRCVIVEGKFSEYWDQAQFVISKLKGPDLVRSPDWIRKA